MVTVFQRVKERGEWNEERGGEEEKEEQTFKYTAETVGREEMRGCVVVVTAVVEFCSGEVEEGEEV